MSLNGTGNDWGDKIAAIVDDSDFNGDEVNQVRDFWRAACTIHEDHLIANVLVQTTSGAPNGEHTGEIQ